MVPEDRVTPFDRDQLISVAVTATGPVDDPAAYSARLVENMALLAELALPDLAQQLISASAGTDGTFLNVVLEEVSYDEATKRGCLWFSSHVHGDDERTRAVSNADADRGFKIAADGQTVLEMIRTERLFFEQGRAVYNRAKQLVGHKVSLVKHVYSGSDKNKHRVALAVVDRGLPRRPGAQQQAPQPAQQQAPAPAAQPAPAPAQQPSQPAPAPAPVQQAPAPAAQPAPAPAQQQAPAAAPQPAEQQAPAAAQQQAPAVDLSDVDVSDVDVLDAGWSPTDLGTLKAAYSKLGYTSQFVNELATTNNISSGGGRDVAAIASLWQLLRDHHLEQQAGQLDAALAG